MKLKKISVTNVRSFLERQELLLDGEISIIIGPNGGGKTNLLDSVVASLRRHLFASTYPVQVSAVAGQDVQYEFRVNDQLNQLVMEKHSGASGEPQLIELEIEVTQPDIENMTAMSGDAQRLTTLASKRYRNLSLNDALHWDLANLPIGTRLQYCIQENSITHDGSAQATLFLQYLTFMNPGRRPG